MANEQNLKSFTSNQSHEEAVRNGSKGGIKSGQARREKKIFKEAIAERMGYKDFEEMIDNLIVRAKNNDKSFEVLRDTLGQKPTESVELNAEVNNPFANMSIEELRKIANSE